MGSIHSTILSLFAERGSQAAFKLQQETGGYRSLSYAQAREKSLKLSAYLRSRGVQRGDRVMLVSENGPEWLVAALAVLNLGAVLVPVAAIGSSLEIENTLRGACPKFCIYSRDIAAARHLAELVDTEKVESISWRLQSADPLEAWLKLEPWPLDQSVGENEVALLIFTSGTTGTPKGVPITHGNILANARGVLKILDVSSRDRVVSVLPLSHMLEFTGGFVLPALAGVEITYIKGLKPEDLLRALRDSRATTMIGVPLLFEVIARNLQSQISSLPQPLPAIFKRFSLWTIRYPALGKILFYPVHRALGGHIRFLAAGGSKLHAQTFEYFRGLGITLLQGYGLTETSPVLTFTTLENAGPDHVGRAVPGVEIGIFSDEGARLPVGQEGEIWAKGPNVFAGYLDPRHSEGAFQNGWFKTGDLGTLDARGLLRITGRKKDIIVTSAGKNVYPEEIEGIMLASNLFLEASVLGVKDDSGHEKILLVLVPDRARFPGRNQGEIAREASAAALEAARALADYKWPQKVEVLFEELPKTSTRKVKKHELRKMLAARAEKSVPAGAEAGTGLKLGDALEGTIARAIAEITKIDAGRVRLDDSLSQDLGLDSLTFVELIGQVEKKFNARIEGVDFAAILTVRDLVAALGFAAKQKNRFRLSRRVFFTEFAAKTNVRIQWRIPRCIFNGILRVVLAWRHDLEVSGLENLDQGGPFVFTPNHASHFDLLSIAGALPRRMVHRTFAVAAKDYFFNGTLKALGARAFVNAIPFDRKGRVNESMQRCREALDEGYSLVIFPEGTRSPHGLLQEFKPGVGQLLAAHANARAVPVFIDGAYQIMPKGSGSPKPGKLKVSFGKPISFRDLGSHPESYRLIADRLRAEVVDLSRGLVY